MHALTQNPDFLLGMALGALAVFLLILLAMAWLIIAHRLDPDATARDRAEQIAFDRLVAAKLQQLQSQGLSQRQHAAAGRKARAQARNWPRHGDRTVDCLRHDTIGRPQS